MRIYKNKEEWTERGYVFCEDCQHFKESTKTPYAIGACGMTKNRTVFVQETGKNVPHMQGLAYDTQKNGDCLACYPSAPRRCTKYQKRFLQSVE